MSDLPDRKCFCCGRVFKWNDLTDMKTNHPTMIHEFCYDCAMEILNDAKQLIEAEERFN
jgi:hypothetical protein